MTTDLLEPPVPTPTRWPATRDGLSRRQVRALVGITLLVSWVLATLTGVLLEVAPEVPRAGQQELLFGLTQRTWGDIHWWVSVLAVAVTVVHLATDWRTFRGCLRAMTHRTACPDVSP
jgi:hypothetical protein